MRKLRAWGLAATLMVGLSAATAWGVDEADSNSKSTSKSSGSPWNPLNWFNSKDKKADEKKKTATKSEKDTAKKPATPSRPVSVVDEAAAARSREEAVLLRRLAVCDKLMEIAVRNNDTELLRRVEVLDERARSIYAQRTAHLVGSTGEFQSDEQILEKHLGTPNAKKPHEKEAPAYSVLGNDKNSRAAKEANP